MRKRIYIIAPYTIGDVAGNVKTAMEMWHILWQKGYQPYCPHLCHFLHMYSPLEYDDWMEFGKGWLALCELAIRIPGDSTGSDLEVRWAEKLGIPVFFDINDLTTEAKFLLKVTHDSTRYDGERA